MDIRLTNEYKIQINDDGTVKLFKAGKEIAETSDMLATKAAALKLAAFEYSRLTQRDTVQRAFQGPISDHPYLANFVDGDDGVCHHPFEVSGYCGRPKADHVPARKKIKANKARCRKCGDTIESKHRHDFVYCKCEAIAVDGGKAYIRRLGEATDIEELTEYEES